MRTNEFSRDRLRRHMLPEHPMRLFATWYEQASSREPWKGQAAVLSTVGERETPSGRIILVKRFDDDGFCFFTNYESRKGMDLAIHPACSLVFWWPTCIRQVRIEGAAEKVDDETSDAYFASRSRESQLGAWSSRQSRVVESRAVLEKQTQAQNALFEQRDVSRPPHWGGYRVRPVCVEFWQGGPSRLHDRFLYSRASPCSDAWNLERLSP